MGYLRSLHSRLEQKRELPESDRGLEIRTSFLREVPSKVGLSLAAFRLLVLVAVAVISAFAALVLTIPKYDYIVEKRLGDNYRTTFSNELPEKPSGPSAHYALSQPIATDMDQDADKVYLATRGHGIQALSKGNSLWKTHDEISTDGELRNDIAEIKCRKNGDNTRLWTLGFDGSITRGEVGTFGVDFQCLFGSGFWRHITLDEITATIMIGQSHVVFGTSGKGAGAYNVVHHTWNDFVELQNKQIPEFCTE